MKSLIQTVTSMQEERLEETATAFAKIEQLVRMGLMPTGDLGYLKRAMTHMESGSFMPTLERTRFYKFISTLMELTLNDPAIHRQLKNKVAHMKEETELDEGKGPLEGHPYHKMTDAELNYVLKDAGSAAKAVKGHSPESEKKYLDQVNDASTVLAHRRRGGKKVNEAVVRVKPQWEIEANKAAAQSDVVKRDLAKHKNNISGAVASAKAEFDAMAKGTRWTKQKALKTIFGEETVSEGNAENKAKRQAYDLAGGTKIASWGDDRAKKSIFRVRSRTGGAKPIDKLDYAQRLALKANDRPNYFKTKIKPRLGTHGKSNIPESTEVNEAIDFRSASDSMLRGLSQIIFKKRRVGEAPTEADRQIVARAKAELRRRRNMKIEGYDARLEAGLKHFEYQNIAEVPEDRLYEFFTYIDSLQGVA